MALVACGGSSSKPKSDKQASAARERAARKATRRHRRRHRARGCQNGLVPQGTLACVRRDGQPAGCGGNPYSTPTRSGGCIGPAHPPSSGPATHCPPGQVPAGQTGACAPPQAPSGGRSGGAGAPSVDSPEGQQMLHNSPDCRGHPPPPPSYHGPVQC